MAGSSCTLTSDSITNAGYDNRYHVRKIIVDWVGDSGTGAVPTLTLVDLYGYCIKAITNPGSTAPTDNYDIKLGDPNDTALDALAGALADRDTATTEAVYPAASGAATPCFLERGDYLLAVTGNSVNSATGRIILYLADFQ